MSNYVRHCLAPLLESSLHCSRVRSPLCAALSALLLGCGHQEILFADGPTGGEIETGTVASSPPAAPAMPVPVISPPASPPPLVPPAPEPAPVPTGSGPSAPPEPAAAEPAPAPPEPAPCAAFGAFAEPELITGLGLSAETLGPVFSADGLTLFFSTLLFSTLSAAGDDGVGDEDIFSAQREQSGSTQFAPAEPVPNLDAGGSDEGTPFLSFDGLSLYFFSTRPGPGAQGDRDIWLAQRPTVSAPFEEPVVLPGVNGPDIEHLPRLSRDELSITFVSSRESPNEATNLWIAQRESRSAEFAAPVEVAGINGNSREEGFSLSPDGLTLFFSSNRLDLEQMDLFVATRPNAAASFGTPEPLVQLNSDADELDPQLSPDGLELFFASSRAGGFQLFRALRECDTP